MSDAGAAPPSSGLAGGHGGFPVLRLVRPLAGVAVATMILGRGVAPSAKGVGVGIGRVIRAVEVTGAALSQIFALGAIAVAISAILSASKSRLSYPLRIGAIALGGFVILTSIWAARAPIPGISAALIGVSASILAIVAAGSSITTPFARGPAAVLGLSAVASLLRLAAVALAYQVPEPGWSRVAPIARSIATISFAFDALALTAATAWIAAQSAWKRRSPSDVAAAGGPDRAPPEPGARRLTSPATVVILAAALLLTRQALKGQQEDGGSLNVLLWRTAEHLMSRPEAGVPLGFRVFAAFLAPLLAVVAVSTRGAVPALTASVALVLFARLSPEVPLCALVLLVASLCVALAAQDERGMWAAISARLGGSR